MSDITQRKADHLDLTTRGDVGFRRNSTLLEYVELVHDALPELSFPELDTGLELFGKKLRAPLLIAAMTGGHERAESINRELASIAEERGIAFGLGSQRAMLTRPHTRTSYKIRGEAPNALVLGNLGIVQATAMGTAEIAELVGEVGADALCVHLNPAMELVQDDGDRDFRRGLETLSRLLEELDVPVIAKETGCGLSPSVGRRLRALGVRHVDVSGAGGTSWVAVETERASPRRRGIGETFREWGIPTAASVAFMARSGFDTIFATGGIQSGLDAAKSIALGATAAGIARPTLKALDAGGRAGAVDFLSRVEEELRVAMLLVGAGTLPALARAPRVVLGPLKEWLIQLGGLSASAAP